MISNQKPIVILGGGIHGASVAYYLALRHEKPLIIERTNIAAAASGKAGGFLAREWGSGPTIPLHQLSFDLHGNLAKELNIESYRTVTTLSVNGNRRGKSVASWLDRKVSSDTMQGATAQVTPSEFTHKLTAKAIEMGAEVLIAGVKDIIIEDKKITGVQLTDGRIIETDKVVVTLGPWSGVYVEDWFGLPLPMDGIKSTSVVFNNNEAIKSEPYACFCEEDSNSCHLEIYPRPNGDVYICGIGGSDYVRGDRLRRGGDCESADLIKSDASRVAAAMASLSSMSSVLGSAPPDVTQACMRPCTPDALPVMGRIPDVTGAYISTGHNCWGILWAPISGLCMSELIIDGICRTVNLDPFRPDRFMNSDRKQRGRKQGVMDVGEQW